MRALFFGSTEGTACSLHYFTSLVRLGHETLPFDPRYFTPRGTWERIQIRARKAPTASRVREVSDRLVGLCRDSRFDLVLVMAENFLGRETLEEIRHTVPRPPRFLYHSHDNNFAPGILKPPGFFETLASYDAVFTTKSQNVARYGTLGQTHAHYVPSAYEPTVHLPVAPAYSRFDRDFDVTFVGTYDGSRPALLDAAGWDRLHVWGSGWKRWPGYARHSARITPRPAYYFEFADVLSRSRCALGLLREEADDRHTQRTFEIPACGALQIAPRNDEILGFFEEGKEIVCFASLEELKEKIDYYLAHESERRRIARAGHERCVRDRHTYVDRVAEMIRLACRQDARAASVS